MTQQDERLVAVLVTLQAELAPVVDQLLAGQLDAYQRQRLAAMFELIARDLRPTILPPDDAGDAGGR